MTTLALKNPSIFKLYSLRRIKLLDPENFAKNITMIIAALAVLGTLHLVQINSQATRGFEIRQLESQKVDLQKQNDQLQVAITEAKSSSSIMARIDNLKMVPAGQISYISNSGDTVAMAK